MSSSSRIFAVSLRAAGLLAFLGLVAWGTGEPFIFPSLGPTAFLLSDWVEGDDETAWAVIGSHIWGTLAGLGSYHVLASGYSLVELSTPATTTGLALAASGTLAMGLTSVLMISTRSVHPPACATTLIVSLGLLSSLGEGAIIIAAVTGLYGLAWILRRNESDRGG